MKIKIGYINLELDSNEIKSFLLKNKKTILKISIISLVVLMPFVLGDLFIFYKLGFPITSYFSMIINDYLYKWIVLVFFTLILFYFIIYAILFIAEEAIKNIDFSLINSVESSVKYTFFEKFKKVVSKLFKINFLLVSFFSVLCILSPLFISAQPYIFLFIIFIFGLNLLFLSYLYKKLFIIDNNFINFDKNITFSIVSNNLFINFVSIFISLFLLGIIFGLINNFIFGRNILLYQAFEDFGVFISFAYATSLLVFDSIIKAKILKKFTISKNKTKNIYLEYIFYFIMLVAIFNFLINNSNSFMIKIINNDITNKSDFYDFSFNLIFNKGLLKNTTQPITIIEKKLNEKLKIIDSNIAIRVMDKEHASSYVEISRKLFIYFTRKRDSKFMNIYLVKVENGKYILLEKSIKRLDTLLWNGEINTL